MNKHLLAGALLVSLFLQSCEDRDLMSSDPGVPLAPGSSIDFGVGLSPQSRTVYGDRDTVGNVIVFPIYWSHPDDGAGCTYDSIYIYGHTAESGGSYGKYVVKPRGSKTGGLASVEKADGDSDGVSVGVGEHSFYAFYPYSAIVESRLTAGTERQSYVYAEMPVVQTVTVPDAPDEQTGCYVASHTMDHCLMKASLEGHTPLEGKPVMLQFEPWSTVLDITVQGPKSAEEGGFDETVVTSVIVRSKKSADSERASEPCIVGTFRCNLSDDKVEFETVSDRPESEPDHILTVDIVNSRGDKGVTLTPGQTLNLKAFLVPTDSVEALDVEVYAQNDNKMWVMSLKAPEGGKLLQPGQIHNVGLPKIVSPGVDDYSSWMTNTPGDILVSQMSIPGSFESFTYAYDDANKDKRVQQCDIATQFEAGIRAFQARVMLKSGRDDLQMKLGTSYHLEITADGTTRVMDLGEAIHILHQEMQSRGDMEFCVLQLRAVNGSDLQMLNATLKNYATHMANTLKITPKASELKKYTLNELRGKILLQFSLPADPALVGEDWRPHQTSPATGTISQFSNIERWLTRQANQTFYSWDCYNIPLRSKTTVGLPSWAQMHNSSVLLSWETMTNTEYVTVTPVTYGRVGGTSWIGYTSAYRTQAAVEALYDSMDEENYESTNYDALMKFSQLTAPTYAEDYGLGYFNQLLVRENIQLRGTADGMDRDNIYIASLDIDHSKLALGEYPWFYNYQTGKVGDMFFWLHGEVPYGSTSASKQYSFLETMWDVQRATRWVQKYYDVLGEKLFITTSVGLSGYLVGSDIGGFTANSLTHANHMVVMNFARMAFNRTAHSSYGVANQIYHITGVANEAVPLGVMYFPNVPDRRQIIDPKTSGGQTDEKWLLQTGYNVRGMISTMIEHNETIYNSNSNSR